MIPFDTSLISELNAITSKTAYARGPSAGRGSPMGLARIFPQALSSDDEEIAAPAIEGILFTNLRVMRHKGENITFAPRCITSSLASGDKVLACVDHDPEVVLADTRTAISIIETKDDVRFRLNVLKAENPLGVLGIVASGNRACVSVGLDIIASETHDCGGTLVRFITEAKLREFSFVKAGLDTTAFAFVTDANKYGAPTPTASSVDFERNRIFARVSRIVADVSAAVKETEQLSARITAIEVAVGITKQRLEPKLAINIF